MPRVTSIEPQKKRPNRFNIYLEGNFAFALDAENLLKNNLKIGQFLSEEEVNDLTSKDVLSKLTDKTLHFLSLRPRSESEILNYLSKKISRSQNIPFQEAKESYITKTIIQKLKKYDYLNDREFARFWIRSRIKLKPKGKIALKNELQVKGIDKEIIDSVLLNLPNQVVIAKKAIEKKLKLWKSLPQQELKKKVYSYLSTRGFDFETIGKVFAFLKKLR